MELAAEIRAARSTKPIVGIANSMAASAAYWLGSACSELYCTPSGQVGSIGVIASHDDMSAALEQAGIRTTLITAGPNKAEGNQLGPLTRAARSTMQAMVDSYGADFERAVALGRGVGIDAVRRSFGQGRMLRASEAKRVGMVDGVAQLDDVLAGRAKPATTSGARAYLGLPPALAAAMRQLDILGAGKR